MKEGGHLGLGILMVLLIVSQIGIGMSAEGDNQAEGDDKASQEVDDTGKKTGQDLTAAAKGLQDEASGALEKEMTLSPSLDKAVRIIFGLKKEEKINMQGLVVFVCLFFILFLFIMQLISFTSQKGGMRWITSLLFTFIISAFGVINLSSGFLFGFAGAFEILRGYKLAQLSVALIILFAAFAVFSKIISLIKKRFELGKAKKEGEEAAKGIQVAKELGGAIKEE